MRTPIATATRIVVLAFLSLSTTFAHAQHSPPATKLGVYTPGGKVTPAKLLIAAPVQLPPGETLASGKRVTALSFVVDAAGKASHFVVLNTQASPLDDLAIAAVKQSTFVPGSLNNAPVPVHAFAWVPFIDVQHPVVPIKMTGTSDVFNVKSPKPLNSVEAEFSDQARREGVSGTVLVHVLLSDKGVPLDVHIPTPIGYGLDEEAIKAVKKYRFEPAELEGIPVPLNIVVEVNFRL